MVWACPINIPDKVSFSHICPQVTAWEKISHRRVEMRKVRYLKGGCPHLHQLHLASFSTEAQKGTPAESSSKADGWSRSNKVPSGETCCCPLSTWWDLGNYLGGELCVPQLQCLHCLENMTKPSNLLSLCPVEVTCKASGGIPRFLEICSFLKTADVALQDSAQTQTSSHPS